MTITSTGAPVCHNGRACRLAIHRPSVPVVDGAGGSDACAVSRPRQQRLLRCPAAMRAIERTRRDSVVWRRRCSAYPWMTPRSAPKASSRLLLAGSLAHGAKLRGRFGGVGVINKREGRMRAICAGVSRLGSRCTGVGLL
jgi:hypothetical protein